VFPKQRVAEESVLVAYDGSAPSARTLASFAQSGLGDGRTVHIVSCNSDRDQAAEWSEMAGRYLSRRGLHVELHALEGPPGETILALAGSLTAGLLAMGAFGHTSVYEFLFGSTTREILERLPLPVFLDR
jgi:nucleotide-binding universal stress UspA family protein